jgi:hypothetical protein
VAGAHPGLYRRGMPFPAAPRVLVALCLVVAAASAARADELDDLRRENARLKSEVQSLQAQLDGLRGGGANAAAAAPAAGAGSRMEPVYIPRTRVSLEVGRDEATGATTLATLWYRTADTGPLPRKEWLQLRAEQMPDGTLRGPWMLVERQGAAGGGKVGTGTLTVDGKPIELAVADYDAKRKNQTLGQITSSTRDERIRFALPATALPLVANARTVRFAAGGIDFQLTDEHLAAFAAMATRVAAAPAAAR